MTGVGGGGQAETGEWGRDWVQGCGRRGGGRRGAAGSGPWIMAPGRLRCRT
ncbi:MAG: hypothetical protein QXW06_05310 [Thermoplasmata archaeon]